MSDNSTTPNVPCFDSVEAFREGLKTKKKFEPIDLYPRDGCVLLAEVEARVAELMGLENGKTVAYNSGMSAVANAIDVALEQIQSNRPVLAFSHGMYKQTKCYIERYVRRRGVSIHIFDSGDTTSIHRLFDELRPDVVVAEAVSNYKNMPVLDVGLTLSLVRASRQKPVLVIDNTLPLSTGLPLAGMIEPYDHVIIVESCTKSYTFNQELLGAASTKHAGLAKSLLNYRRTVGTIPNGASLERIASLLPGTKAAFDERNRRLLNNTEKLALALHEACGRSTELAVSHPAVPEHANHKLYNRDFPVGGTPIFYIESALDYYELAARLWGHAGVRHHAKLGQSFGYDETRILPDESVGALRIAGGATTDVDKLAPALAEALMQQ